MRLRLSIIFIFLFSSSVFCQTHIKTQDDFININNDLNGNYILDNDIDFQGKKLTPIGFDKINRAEDYEKIDTNKENGFKGTLDGNGHSIRNFRISILDDKSIENNSENSYAGLFSIVNAGTIKNLKLENARVYGYKHNVGGLAGLLYNATVENVGVVNADIFGNRSTGGLVGASSNSTIKKSHSSGRLKGGYYSGGLVGFSDANSKIIQSYSSVRVDGFDRSGGLVGLNNNASILQSYATGDVVSGDFAGGLVGDNDNVSPITQSYSTGSVRGKNYVGGFLGENDDDIIQCYSVAKEIVGTQDVGNFIGRNYKNNKKIKYGYALNVGLPYIDCAGFDLASCNFKMQQDESMTISKSVMPQGFEESVWQMGSDGYPTIKNIP